MAKALHLKFKWIKPKEDTQFKALSKLGKLSSKTPKLKNSTPVGQPKKIGRQK